MGLADKVGTGEVVTLDPKSLKYGPRIRSERVSIDHVNRLRPVLDACPPIVVAHPSMQIVDGHHRSAAAGLERVVVRAVLVALKEDEILERAVSANVAHGLTLTTDERKSNATKMAKDCPDWTDRRIAEACGISDKTVADLRPKRARSGAESPHLNTKRAASDGKRYPSDPAAQRAAVDAELEADPAAPARQVARKTGASPATVLNRKAHLAAVPAPPEGAPPTVGDLIVMAPTVWKDEPACQRSDATREFARFMDRFTRWNNKGFYEWVEVQAPECPADLRREAADVARSMSDAWTRLAESLSKHTLMEAK